MIERLGLANFKCFAEQELELGGLTLLTGLNGMGKSSVMQSLLLLRQSYQQRLLQSTGLALNGDLVRLGTVRDAMFEGAEESFVDLNLAFRDGTRANWRFQPLAMLDETGRPILRDRNSYDQTADVITRLHGPDEDDAVYQTSLFGDDFHYLQAERIGPRISFGMSDYQVRVHRQLGAAGEFASHFLTVFGEKPISNPALGHPQAVGNKLIEQVEAWISEVSPGTRLHASANRDIDLVGLRFSFAGTTDVSSEYRPTNVGFGLTYTLPVLVAALSAAPGSLLLIENPEAHLHPKGQGLMGDLLARTAAGGVQVLIETHSDHVLNGIRLAVHGGRLDPEAVRIHYFERHDLQSAVVSPRIDRDGRIDEWPDGFFDEWDKSLEALLEPRSEP